MLLASSIKIVAESVCTKVGRRIKMLLKLLRWGNLRERKQLEDPGVDRRIILRWIFRKWDVGEWTGSVWLRIGTGGGHL
jgi:hypothetical protein